MDITEVQHMIEAIAEALVLADPTDLPALAEMHTQFGEIAQWAGQNDAPEARQLAAQSAELVERVILEEVAADDAFDVVSQAVECLQAMVRDGRPVDEIDFPPAFDIGPAPASSESAQTAPAPAPAAEAAPQAEAPAPAPPAEEAAEAAGDAPLGMPGFSLPAYVDETIFSDFLARQPGVLEDIEELVLALEHEEDEARLGELRRAIHTLKGESALLGLEDVERLCHRAEDALGQLPASALTDFFLNMKDWLSKAFPAYAGAAPAPAPVSTLLDQIEQTLNPAPPEQPETPEPAQAPQTPAPPPEPPAPQAPEPPRAAAEDSEEALEPHPLDGDRELMGDFVVEATEHLDAADVHLLTLETDPEDTEAINAVFRAFHTIKGVAGFMNLDEIQSLAHEAETVLDKVRKNELRLEGAVIDATFDAVDTLKQLVANLSEALSSGGLFHPVAGMTRLVVRLKAIAAGELGPDEELPEAAQGERLGEILVRTGTATEEGVERALSSQTEPPQKKKLGDVLVEQAMTGRTAVQKALDEQHRSKGEKRTGEILVEMGAASSDDVAAALEKQSKPPAPSPLGELLVRSKEAPAKEVAHALRSQRKAQAAGEARSPGRPQQAVQVREAVKVDANRLDRLVDTIGELVIAEAMVREICTTLAGMSANNADVLDEAAVKARLTRHLGQLDKITRELQEMGTGLRMVPVRSTFQKMARLVRDLAKKSGKEVEFVMTGEDTELDKSVVDKIGDPLVHMIRNAVDHGLEASPEDRVNAGKASSGRVELRAFHKGGSIYLEIEDDGRGLNRDAILAKARERGLLGEDETPPDRDVWNLIFEPGFSTAKKITDVSGRGVGMDVVRRNIESLRGQVDIRSTPGKGSVFTIRLPLTLAIIDGMVVRLGQERYVIPTLSIAMSVRPGPDAVSSVVNRNEMLQLQGALLPLFRLGRLFELDGAVDDVTAGIVVVVEDEGRRTGLLVDELLGQQQIVIKSLGEAMQGIPGIAGGAIMPDGAVGLILDVGGLVRLAHEMN